MHAPPRATCTYFKAYQNAVREVRAKKDADEIRMIATEVLRNPYRKP